MSQICRSGVFSLTQLGGRIPGEGGERNALALARGSLDLRLVLPLPPNRQDPHRQDELYFVARGRGTLVHEGHRTPFAQGDVLFVAAGVDHHYDAFSADLALWRVFYGAEGGEVPPADQISPASGLDGSA